MTTQEPTTTFVTKPPLTAPRGFVNVRVTLNSWGPGLLMNPMTEDILDALAGVKSKAASDKEIPLQERAEKKVIRENGDEDGRIGVPVTYVSAALIYAGRFVKNGKKQISTTTSTTLYEFLMMEDEFFPFTQYEEMIVDKRRGVSNNAGKTAAVAIIRPKFKRWELQVNVSIDTSIINAEVVKQLFAEAGRKAGIGDFRPSRKGPFGMFYISGWDVFN